MDYKLPENGKKLFETNNSYLEFSYFGWGDVELQFYGYIKGYKESADILVEYCLKSKSISTLDTIIFPILFLYRQFIELSLKSLYLKYSDSNMKERIQTLKRANHNLDSMWKKLKPILLEAFETEEDIKLIRSVENYVLQYHNYDRTSFKFRYPIDKNYNKTIKGEERIDLVNLKERLQELDNFFSGADGKLSAIKDWKQEQEQYIREIEAELRAEYEAEMRAEYAAEMRSYMEW